MGELPRSRRHLVVGRNIRGPSRNFQPLFLRKCSSCSCSRTVIFWIIYLSLIFFLLFLFWFVHHKSIYPKQGVYFIDSIYNDIIYPRLTFNETTGWCSQTESNTFTKWEL